SSRRSGWGTSTPERASSWPWIGCRNGSERDEARRAADDVDGPGARRRHPPGGLLACGVGPRSAARRRRARLLRPEAQRRPRPVPHPDAAGALRPARGAVAGQGHVEVRDGQAPPRRLALRGVADHHLRDDGLAEQPHPGEGVALRRDPLVHGGAAVLLRRCDAATPVDALAALRGAAARRAVARRAGYPHPGPVPLVRGVLLL